MHLFIDEQNPKRRTSEQVIAYFYLYRFKNKASRSKSLSFYSPITQWLDLILTLQLLPVRRNKIFKNIPFICWYWCCDVNVLCRMQSWLGNEKIKLSVSAQTVNLTKICLYENDTCMSENLQCPNATIFCYDTTKMM